MENSNASYSGNSVNEKLLSPSLEKKLSYKKGSLCEIPLLRRIDGKTHTTWQEYTVQNVSQYLIIDDHTPPTVFECPSFSSGPEIDNENWSWKICFDHYSYFSGIHIYAHRTKNGVGVRAIIAAYVLDNKGNEIFLGHFPCHYRSTISRQIATFFDKYSDFDKEKFLVNDSLTVRLKVTILLDDKTPLPVWGLIKLKPRANLPSHFEELYRNRESTGDIVIKIKEQLFRAHKEVLKIRYPQLLDKFANQIVQGKKNFGISGLDCDVFEKLLEFLYLDKVTDIDDCIVRLWKAAHKYQLTALKSICEKIISEDFLSVENVDMVNDLANKFGSVEFRIYIMQFLDQNNCS